MRITGIQFVVLSAFKSTLKTFYSKISFQNQNPSVSMFHYFRQGGYVFDFGLFVCQQDDGKINGLIFIKFGERVQHGPTKNFPSKFFFTGISNQCHGVTFPLGGATPLQVARCLCYVTSWKGFLPTTKKIAPIKTIDSVFCGLSRVSVAVKFLIWYTFLKL